MIKYVVSGVTIMANHYYSRQPEVESVPKYWETELRHHKFRFKTDRGVFSNKEVDFGSRFLVETIDIPDVAGAILDVGCGYGPIGLTLAKECPGREVHLVDVNQRAIGLAKENAKENAIEHVKIYESDTLKDVEQTDFALIVTNPPIRAGKVVVHDILARSYEHLVENGELWVVIQKKQGAPSAKAKMEEVFGHVDVIAKNKGYYLLRSIKC